MKIITEPTIEPVSLNEVKEHLRIDASSDFADSITSEQTIVPDEYGAGTDTGTGIDVLNYRAVVNLNCGTFAATSTLDVTIQESDNNVAYSNWGTFAQVTTASDDAIYEKEYTGTKQYIRCVGVTANANSTYGCTVIKGTPYSAEDDVLTRFISAARVYCEEYQGRAYITQTWEKALDDFPAADTIQIPIAPLQSVTSVKYYDTDETESTLSDSYYYVDTYKDPGRIVLQYGYSWPSDVLRPANGVIIRYVCGYGDNATDVPESIRQAILLLVGHFYENRENSIRQNLQNIPFGVVELLMLQDVNLL